MVAEFYGDRSWRAQDLMPADNKWGFRIRMPERKYNLGELHNLCIGRGSYLRTGAPA
jgi:hypothetical protein